MASSVAEGRNETIRMDGRVRVKDKHPTNELVRNWFPVLAAPAIQGECEGIALTQ